MIVVVEADEARAIVKRIEDDLGHLLQGTELLNAERASISCKLGCCALLPKVCEHHCQRPTLR